MSDTPIHDRAASDQDDVIALMKNARLSLPIGRAPERNRPVSSFLPVSVRLLGRLFRPMVLLGIASGMILGHVGGAVVNHHFGVPIDAAIPEHAGPVVQGGAISAWGRGVGLNDTLAESRPTLFKLTQISDTMKQRGASPEQIARLLHHMAEAASVTVFGRPDRALERQDAEARAQNLEILQRLWAARRDDAQWAALHKTLAKEEGARRLGVFYFRNDRNVEQREDSIGVQRAHDIPSAIYFSSWVDGEWLHSQVSDDQNDPEALKQARANLAQAVHDAGLAAWKVPAVRWARADLLNQDARNLRRANQELEQVTGWHGGVLGLNNRVIVNNNSWGDGKTSVAMDGRHTLILADWDTLGHEWFHALDDTLGKGGAVWAWRDAQISDRSQTGLKSPESDRRNWLASPLWTTIAGWVRRGAVAAEGNYSLTNDRNDQVAQRAVQTLWVGLARPNLSETQRERILDILHTRREELVGLKTDKADTTHQDPRGVVSGEALIFNRARATLARTPVKELVAGGSSPWFTLRMQTGRKITQALPQVRLRLRANGYRFDEASVVGYVTKPTEMLAYAFAAQVAWRGAGASAKPILVEPDMVRGQTPEWNMTQPEAQADAAAWTAFFTTLHPWWEHDRVQRMGPPATPVVAVEHSGAPAVRAASAHTDPTAADARLGRPSGAPTPATTSHRRRAP